MTIKKVSIKKVPIKKKAIKKKTSTKIKQAGFAKAGLTKEGITKKVTADPKKTIVANKPSYIVGIGASAGGLEAFNTFFNSMVNDSGLAFVLIVHLDPDHVSLLPELIQKKTRMKVYTVVDNMTIQANSVYIIPPNKEMAILNGALQLLDLQQAHGLNRPIDTFFQSLAQDQGEKSIAIILSGTGSDGSLGLRRIKAESGLVIVQDIESAKYDGMPRNAIATGLVDQVLVADKIAQNLFNYVQHLKSQPTDQLSGLDENILNALQKIYVLLRASTGHDFSLYKVNTICRRIERRMHVHQIDFIDDYVHYLQENESEVTTLFKELLIGVTNFFRDPQAFEHLGSKFLTTLLQEKNDDSPIRVWVPGCSTGEEVYSIAILLRECMEKLNCHFSVQVFGTDIDEEAINTARGGCYSQTIVNDVSPQRLKRFFTNEDNSYQIKKTIREMVVFAPQNLTKDPPFTKLDLLCCRNLLIYFGQKLQKNLFPVFHYSLKQGGLLFLGSSETIGQATDLFTLVDKKYKIFKRLPNDQPTVTNLNFSTPVISSTMPEKISSTIVEPMKEMNTLTLLKNILSQSDMSARVVVDSEGNIIYVHGKTGNFLEPAEGAMSINVIEMARSGLKAGLTNAIRRVASSGKEIKLKGLKVKINDGYCQVNLFIKPFPDIQVAQKNLMILIFEEVSADLDSKKSKTGSQAKDKPDNLKILEDELQYTKENLQSTIEELESSNEEMKSTNEELQSTNEELQSTNEELETSKEELQSLNEESSTVNAELQSRIDELMSAKDDIKNLLDATEIASIFLDIELNIRRFTPKAIDIFPLTQMDFGRPIKHFASNLIDIDLQHYAQKVFADLSMIEEEVSAKDGTIFRMRLRPYRTTNNVIDGIVITFEDITKIKKVESEINLLSSGFEERLFMMSKVFMDAPDPIIIQDLKGTILEVNDEAIQSYGWSREELLGKNIKLLTPTKDQAKAEQLLKQCQQDRQPLRDINILRRHKSGEELKVILTLSLLTDLQGNVYGIASTAKT